MIAALFAAGTMSSAAAAQAPDNRTRDTVTIVVVPVISAAATYIAADKGYFRDAGLDIELEAMDSSAGAMALLATGRAQVVEGGVAVGYFNAVAQGLPVILAFERGSSPLNHDLVVRPDLQDRIRAPADLKGRSVALVAPGSIRSTS